MLVRGRVMQRVQQVFAIARDGVGNRRLRRVMTVAL
jgi:hypothetical protein